VFLGTVAIAGTIGKVLGVWLLLWLVVVAGLAAPFVLSRLDGSLGRGTEGPRARGVPVL